MEEPSRILFAINRKAPYAIPLPWFRGRKNVVDGGWAAIEQNKNDDRRSAMPVRTRSLVEFQKLFPDEAAYAAFLFAKCWP